MDYHASRQAIALICGKKQGYRARNQAVISLYGIADFKAMM
jgi:hypothetical protein